MLDRESAPEATHTENRAWRAADGWAYCCPHRSNVTKIPILQIQLLYDATTDQSITSSL